jgi:hypothetical protein
VDGRLTAKVAASDTDISSHRSRNPGRAGPIAFNQIMSSDPLKATSYGGSLLLILVVTSVVVVLEGWFHAFEYVDELALSVLRTTGQFSLPAARGEAAEPVDQICVATPSKKYVTVLVPDAPEPDLSAPPADSPGPAPDDADFRFQVVKALAALGPAILAVDFDLSLASSAADRLEVLKGTRDTSGRDSTQWVLMVLPIVDDTPEAQSSRLRRNEWLRQACKNPHVVVAAPFVARSQHFGDVVQFHWQNLASRAGNLPPVYPALGQLTRKLDAGASELSAAKGAGFICSQLRARPGSARIPFLDPQSTPAELNDDAFVAAKHPDRSFELAWINPSATLDGAFVTAVRSRRDLARLTQAGAPCMGQKIVFVGPAPSNIYDDAFATAIGEATPGVLVHAMSALSAEISLKSRLALSATLDLLVGLGLTIAAVYAHQALKNRESFVGRTAVAALDKASPILVLTAICILSVMAFRLGWFLNPIVAALGIWLHGLLHDGFRSDQGRSALLPTAGQSHSAWKRAVFWLFPPPRLSVSPTWGAIDRFVYWGLVWMISGLLVWAAWIVVSRGIRLVLL